MKFDVFIFLTLAIIHSSNGGTKPINPYTPSLSRWTWGGLRAFFTYELIVPKCVKNVPNKTCEITFPPVKIQTGMDYGQKEIKGRPIVKWEADENSHYLLYMLGFAPWYVYSENEPPHYVKNVVEREWIQWLVYDIPGNNVFKGKDLYPYFEPPLPDLGLKNVYAIIIYKQPGKMKLQLPKIERFGSHEFCSQIEFAEKHNLTEVAAANLFVYRQFPERSDILVFSWEEKVSSTLDPDVFLDPITLDPDFEPITYNPNNPMYQTPA